MKIYVQLVLLAIWSSTSRGQLTHLQECCQNTQMGCYTNDSPFQDMPLPTCVPEGFKIQYLMFSREQPTAGQKLDIGVTPQIFNGSRKTAFIVHGFIQDGGAAWMTTMKDAFLKREDLNVVIVGWGQGADNLIYPQAASNTRTAGAYTALVIQSLLKEPNTDSSRVWCLGHSLGSHVCGHAGMKMPAGEKLGRITERYQERPINLPGMDPAGPSFESSSDITIGLNPSCASLVDVLHTSTVFGTTRKLGHLDFYPTGYALAIDFLSSSPTWPIGVICDTAVCSHTRAVDFEISSIQGTQGCFATDQHCTNATNIPGSCTKVNGCDGYMGYWADKSCNRTGIFALTVPAKEPFCPGT